jgi:hypothetical protein
MAAGSVGLPPRALYVVVWPNAHLPHLPTCRADEDATPARASASGAIFASTRAAGSAPRGMRGIVHAGSSSAAPGCCRLRASTRAEISAAQIVGQVAIAARHAEEGLREEQLRFVVVRIACAMLSTP